MRRLPVTGTKGQKWSEGGHTLQRADLWMTPLRCQGKLPTEFANDESNDPTAEAIHSRKAGAWLRGIGERKSLAPLSNNYFGAKTGRLQQII